MRLNGSMWVLWGDVCVHTGVAQSCDRPNIQPYRFRSMARRVYIVGFFLKVKAFVYAVIIAD